MIQEAWHQLLSNPDADLINIATSKNFRGIYLEIADLMVLFSEIIVPITLLNVARTYTPPAAPVDANTNIDQSRHSRMRYNALTISLLITFFCALLAATDIVREGGFMGSPRTILGIPIMIIWVFSGSLWFSYLVLCAIAWPILYICSKVIVRSLWPLNQRTLNAKYGIAVIAGINIAFLLLMWHK